MSSAPAILVLNVGSSSVKFRVFAARDDLPLLADGRVTGIGASPVFRLVGQDSRSLEEGTTQTEAIAQVLEFVSAPDHDWKLVAAGHRIVHGGEEFRAPVLLDEEVLARLERYTPLAPLHQRHNLAAVRAVAELNPNLPQVGCFDTAFHADHDAVTRSYALPAGVRKQGVRRYGFHGLSYEWTARVLAEQTGGMPERVVVAHLGNGASLCALKDGHSVDTTMGMTALEGLPMGTRCGALDPGVVLYLQRSLGLSLEEVERLLHDESGLKGLSGGVSDMAELLRSGSPEHAFAVDYFILRVAQKIGEMVVSLGGMDLLVFTGGIGENALSVRERIVRRLAFLPDFQVQVVAADEERMIASQALALINPLSG